MAKEITIPRSGIWSLHSKKDRRWHGRGQYSSLDPDTFPVFVPHEARQAIEELKASLQAEPPDDLMCNCIPYPTPKLTKLFAANAFITTEKQGTFQFLTQTLELVQLSIDLASGMLSFSKPGEEPTHQFPAQFIGLLAQEALHWQWGWVAGERGSMSPVVLKAAQEIRSFGQQHDIPDLTYAEIALGHGDDRPWFSGNYLAMIACHLGKADFYVAMPAPDTPELMMYWIVTAPDVVPEPTNKIERFGLTINEAMTTWRDALSSSDGRKIIRAYAAQKNCTVSEDQNQRMRIDAPAGGHIFIDFEESGGIYGIEFPQEPEPEPKKKHWFKGLLRGKEGNRNN